MYTIKTEENAPLALLETFLTVTRKSVGCEMFQTLYVTRHNGLEDVIGNGDLACAYYVSSILHMFNLIKGGVHTTVSMTVNDMLDSAWSVSLGSQPQPGDIVVWEEKLSSSDRKVHRHIGICIDSVHAVSNDSKTGVPALHRINGLLDQNGKERGVEAYYTHPFLRPVEDSVYT